MFDISNKRWLYCSDYLLHWTHLFFCRMHSSPSLWTVLSRENKFYKKLLWGRSWGPVTPAAHHMDELEIGSSCLLVWCSTARRFSTMGNPFGTWPWWSNEALVSMLLSSLGLGNISGQERGGKQRAFHSSGQVMISRVGCREGTGS